MSNRTRVIWVDQAIKRLAYIDALRTFAMVFGVFLHAGVLTDSLMAAVTAFISDHFRMATFFAISGYFAAMMVGKKGGLGFIRWRLPILAIPLLVGLLVLNPITFYLIHLYNGGSGSFLDFLLGRVPRVGGFKQDWHLHLWFLISLIVYVLLSPALMRLFGVRRFRAQLERMAAWSGTSLLLAVAAVVIVTEIVARILLMLPPGNLLTGTPLNYPVRATLDYLPYFALGLAMFGVPALFEAMHRICLPVLLIGIAIEGTGYALAAQLPEDLQSVFIIAGEETTTVALVAGLLFLFRKWMPEQSILAARLNQSIYTIYLVHYMLLYAVALTVLKGVNSPAVLQLSAGLMALLLGELFHRLLVSRFSLLEILFNGRARLTRRPVTPPAS